VTTLKDVVYVKIVVNGTGADELLDELMDTFPNAYIVTEEAEYEELGNLHDALLAEPARGESEYDYFPEMGSK
jgi:hypothetical protein